ncbi:MAG: glycogen/starch synthase, partial [Gammaproteobacteria bacterium]
MNILFVTPEIFPLIKTGGLADVSASLPRAVQSLGHRVVVLVPAYRELLVAAQPLGVKLLHVSEQDGHGVRILETRLPGSRVRI